MSLLFWGGVVFLKPFHQYILRDESGGVGACLRVRVWNLGVGVKDLGFRFWGIRGEGAPCGSRSRWRACRGGEALPHPPPLTGKAYAV